MISNHIFQNIKINIIAAIFILVAACGASIVMSPSLSAQGIKSQICGGSDLSLAEQKDSTACADNAAATGTLDTLIKNIVNVLSVIIGILAVIFIIIAGFKFITSGGDSGKVTSARNTVIYAIVGLIIVALAQVIVRFVLDKV